MLVPAISKKQELEQKFAEHLYDDTMFFYNGYSHCNVLPDLEPRENIYKWAIVNKNNEVIGYFTYYIEPQANNVCSFGLYSFENDTTIGIDVYKKIKELIKNNRRLEWRMIDTNPVKKYYDHLCKHYHGNRVMLHKVVKSPSGEFLNEYIYEILKEDLIP